MGCLCFVALVRYLQCCIKLLVCVRPVDNVRQQTYNNSWNTFGTMLVEKPKEQTVQIYEEAKIAHWNAMLCISMLSNGFDFVVLSLSLYFIVVAMRSLWSQFLITQPFIYYEKSLCTNFSPSFLRQFDFVLQLDSTSTIINWHVRANFECHHKSCCCRKLNTHKIQTQLTRLENLKRNGIF